MINVTIWLDGKAYQGAHPTEDEPTPGPHGISFHEYNNRRDKLMWGDDNPYILTGARVARSHIDRVLTRMSDNSLKGSELVLKFEEVPNPWDIQSDQEADHA